MKSFDRQLLRIAVNRPGFEDPVVLGVNSLPFGSVASVPAFLRISYAVWRIGVYLFGVVWSALFDDYSCICPEDLRDNTSWTIEMLFDLLGVVFAREGKKAEPFQPCFRMLGLQVNLEGAEDKRMLVGRTPERRSELESFILEILDAGFLDKKTCDRLRASLRVSLLVGFLPVPSGLFPRLVRATLGELPSLRS